MPTITVKITFAYNLFCIGFFQFSNLEFREFKSMLGMIRKLCNILNTETIDFKDRLSCNSCFNSNRIMFCFDNHYKNLEYSAKKLFLTSDKSSFE